MRKKDLFTLASSFVVAFSLFTTVQAKSMQSSKEISAAEEQKMIQHNLLIKKQQLLQRLNAEKRDLLSPEAAPVVARPFSDHEKVSYVFFSAENYFDAYDVKKTILKNLPPDVIAVVFADSDSQAAVANVEQQYSAFVSNPNQLAVIAAPNALGFGQGSNLWARDNVPIPVFGADQKVMSVDAKYYRYYESDENIAQYLGTKLISHDYYYEGGNFQADDDGTCIMVNNSRHQIIPDSLFTEKYGCKRLLRLKHLAGIGHADERLKILKNKVILTDTPEYQSQLEALGYKVEILPHPNKPYETYANALVINDTVFLPVFHEAQDAKAISAYEAQGFKVIPVYVNALPNQGMGSIHCITMTYPAVL